ncbi:la-related protein 6 [Cephus cinctus]|uniref:La-related protein 6 n=1 Tax=Cephus cinctus TaxID=211228 RepID=A0AAJ7BFR9_CEPCN|nr:la-related protein 6 [Cephus cinctus]XP_015585024.1 la-related protein 6 [Cephus cinctus]XP_024936029.1 la-related protein 6 [Cephus cinctus]XP_024936030.1 la-related protein 6 [Cephus cinctus]
MEELEVQQESRDRLGKLTFTPPPMKKSDTRDSISSVDSDLSLTFDRRGSRGEEADLSDSASSDSENKISEKRVVDEGTVSFEDIVARTPGEVPDNSEKITAKESQGQAPADEEFIPPSDELADKICAQVEFYFSDENIVKDAFLLKHVKRNKEGYVSLKLISSFKRVKHLSRDWRVVGAALARSKKLEVNEPGTKLRRLDPLPPFDQTAPSRTVLAARLPVEKLSVEAVAELFRPCGEIALIRILRPGHPAPAEVRQAIAKRPELASSEECALVEFTDSASARAALRMDFGDARIYELQQPSDKKKKQQTSSTKKNTVARLAREEACHSSSCASGSEAEDSRTRHRRPIHNHPVYPMYPGHAYQSPPSPEAWLSRRLSSCSMSGSENGYILRRLSSCSGSGSDTGSFSRRFSTCSSGSENGNYYHHMYSSPYYPQSRRSSCCPATGTTNFPDCNGGTGFNPGRRGSADCGPFLRRLSACSRDSGFDATTRRFSSCSSSGSESGFFVRSRSNSGLVMAHLPENITRMPSGPDGTRGFGRPLQTKINHHLHQVTTLPPITNAVPAANPIDGMTC